MMALDVRRLEEIVKSLTPERVRDLAVQPSLKTITTGAVIAMTQKPERAIASIRTSLAMAVLVGIELGRAETEIDKLKSMYES